MEQIPQQAPAVSTGRQVPQQPSYGFCPENQDPGDGVPRPELSTLLAVRASEMMDQARHAYRAQTASPELRRALGALFAGKEDDAILALADAPDRIQDGFDYAASAAIVLGLQALADDVKDAGRLSARALALAPEDPLTHVLHALVAQRNRAQGDVELALRRAYALAPHEPAIALSLGEALAQTIDLKAAIAALSSYLADAPLDKPIGQLRERLRTQRQLHQGLDQLSGSGITLLWPQPELTPTQADRIHNELASTLAEAADLLEQRRREQLLVVIYRERSELLASTCVPQWTEGVFDGVLRLHADSVRDPNRRRAVIRHEVLHAQLRSVPIHAPHWFHEGAAQFFADEEDAGHQHSYQLMVRNETYVPFSSLEGSFLVISTGRDASLAYHQSLAMVQMMVYHHGPRALAHAVRYLRTETQEPDLWGHMLGESGSGPALLAHLARKLEHLP